MRSLISSVLLLLAVVFLSGCQGFLEDYSYQPVQGMSSASSY